MEEANYIPINLEYEALEAELDSAFESVVNSMVSSHKADITRTNNAADPNKISPNFTPNNSPKKSEYQKKVDSANVNNRLRADLERMTNTTKSIHKKTHLATLERSKKIEAGNVEFKQQFNSVKNGEKQPTNTIKLTTYSYNTNELETVISGLTKDMAAMVNTTISDVDGNYSGRVGEILNATDMFEELFKPYSSNNVKKAGQFAREVLEKYRNTKTTLTFSAASITTLETSAFSANADNAKIMQYVRQLNIAATRLQMSIPQVISKVGNDKSTSARVYRNYRRCASMVGLMSYLYKMYGEALLEKSLSSRIILKKLYKM